MRRCNESVILPFFVFFATIVMMSNVASSYKSTWHYKDTVIDEDSSDSNEIEMNSSIFISRLLKTSPSALRFTERHRNEFDFPRATFQGHTPKSNLQIWPPTSCGQITCDSVPGYPEDIIIEVAKSNNLIPESPKIRSLPKVNFPVARSLDYRYSNTHHPYPPERVQDCLKLKEEYVIFPRESINQNDQAKLLVSLPEYNFAPSAKKCRGPIACRDATTPENKIFKCEDGHELRVLHTFSPEKQKIEQQIMKMPNGCKCGFYDA